MTRMILVGLLVCVLCALFFSGCTDIPDLEEREYRIITIKEKTEFRDQLFVKTTDDSVFYVRWFETWWNFEINKTYNVSFRRPYRTTDFILDRIVDEIPAPAAAGGVPVAR